MKWIDGLTWRSKRHRLEHWHKWFAWFPVMVGITPEGRKVKVWLEMVERKGIYHHHPLFMSINWWEWEYREMEIKDVS